MQTTASRSSARRRRVLSRALARSGCCYFNSWPVAQSDGGRGLRRRRRRRQRRRSSRTRCDRSPPHGRESGPRGSDLHPLILHTFMGRKKGPIGSLLWAGSPNRWVAPRTLPDSGASFSLRSGLQSTHWALYRCCCFPHGPLGALDCFSDKFIYFLLFL